MKTSTHEQYQVISAAEAAALWGLDDSTIRRAILDKRLRAEKSGGTWLVTTTEMSRVYREPKPVTSYPTLNETFFIQNDRIPLTDIGRTPSREGRHVLKAADGAIIVISGYWLRREGEVWSDCVDAVPSDVR